MTAHLHKNRLHRLGVSDQPTPAAVREGQAEVLAHRRRAVDSVPSIVETEMKAWERWLDRRLLEKSIKRLYLSAEAASRAAAWENSGTSPITFPAARRIALKSLKQALHGHLRELRPESIETEGVVKKCVR